MARSALKRRIAEVEGISTSEDVIAALERAGTTLLRLPSERIFPAPLKAAWPSYVRDVAEAYGYNEASLRPAAPQAHEITEMDAAFSWVSLISDRFPTIRKIVLRRALVRPPETIPLTDSRDPHLWGWTRLAMSYGLHAIGDRSRTAAEQVKRAHERGILMILDKMEEI
jgi:hypothetical protein